MSDLIDRQAAIEVADAVWAVTGDKNVAKVWDQIKDLPSAERRGRWICRKADSGFHTDHICSECRTKHAIGWNYCPNCGARMED